MEEIINSVMQSPENTNPNVLRGQLQNMGGGSGGGALMVTDTDGTLDKTMGEIQDAYLAGKRIVISDGYVDIDVIGIVPVQSGKNDSYFGRIQTYELKFIDSTRVLASHRYSTFGETEEAVRNAYPVLDE